MATHSVFSPGESLGQRNLAGCSPRGHKELNRIQRLTLSLHFPLKTVSILMKFY